MTQSVSPIIVALDFDRVEDATDLAQRLDPALCRLKVGNELFTRGGPALVRNLQQREFEVFLDLKFHDIPNTVAAAVRAAAEMGVWMVNVHVAGGSRMLRAAREALRGMDSPPLLIGVTVLTSMSEEDLQELGIQESPADKVGQFAALAQNCGLDGVVCSAQETAALRGACGEDFVLVTPGIRLAGDDAGDQRRVVSPADAIRNGSDYLVIGRPITRAAEPVPTLKRILEDLGVSVDK
jgi:orotidine-5'-phosphate decarboxylase